MKLHIFSDLHFDARTMWWAPALAPEADAVVCAGDVCNGLPEAFAFLRSFIPRAVPIITVAGNHSFRRRVMDEEWKVARTAAQEQDVTLLENETAVIRGIRFIGATLWTDYALDGDRTAAMLAASNELQDHHCITLTREPLTPFQPPHACEKHAASVQAIDTCLAHEFDGPTVVVTHHAPHYQSIAKQFSGRKINAAFASNLDGLIRRRQPALWVHGHTHASCDYRIGRTRIVCNPHGYGEENSSRFDPSLLINVPSKHTFSK